MDYQGELICPVYTTQEDPETHEIVPVNPHQIAASRFGMRLSDATACPIHERPLDPNIEQFRAVGSAETFQLADAADDVDVLWWQAIDGPSVAAAKMADLEPPIEELRALRRKLRSLGMPSEDVRRVIKRGYTRRELSTRLRLYIVGNEE